MSGCYMNVPGCPWHPGLGAGTGWGGSVRAVQPRLGHLTLYQRFLLFIRWEFNEANISGIQMSFPNAVQSLICWIIGRFCPINPKKLEFLVQ